MPYMAPRPCRQPGCPKTTVERDGFCDRHKPVYDHRRYDKKRPSAHHRGYDRHWQVLWKYYLRSHPLCVRCGEEGRIIPATVVDHVKPLSEGGARLNESNLQSLCLRCHAWKTKAEKKGTSKGI